VIVQTLVILPGVLTTSHFEVLTAARSLGTVAVVSLGEPDVEVLARFGVDRVHVPDFDGHPLDPAVVADAAAGVIRESRPDAVLLASTFAGKAIAARLAVLFDGGAIVDVTGLRVDGARVIASKSVLAGTWETECEVTRGLPVFAVKPTSFEPVEAPGGAVAVVRVAAELSDAARAVTLEARVPRPESGRPALNEARVVVAGGRGLDGDFSLVEQLADALGGAVGATRVATDEGWIDHSAQIGQTGVTIAPKLYIGAGVSGAVHHTGGMRAAEVIVAINTDSEAPIFELADFGVVGDAAEVLAQAIEALRER